MITSLFSLVQDDIDENYRIKNLKEHLHKCGATGKFQSIFEEFGNDAEKVIAYLIFAYSFDSTFVTAGEDWKATKEGIMDLLKMSCIDFHEVLSLKKQSVKDAVLYLSKEVKDFRYHQLIVWKESASILDEIATTYPDLESKSTSKNIFDAAKFSYDLKQKATQLENEIRQTSKSTGRLKETQTLDLQNMSMESILKSLKQ